MKISDGIASEMLIPSVYTAIFILVKFSLLPAV